MAPATDYLGAARARMHRVYTPNQILGRTQPVGCTAVEITQRCNLDCTLCYLSENAESTRDIPLAEVLRRLIEIRATYGPGTNVQITELVEIVRYARAIGLRPSLFTNGIAASRKLLTELARVGLGDVAFHVDTTQERPGYSSERDLNRLRLEYLERARGLGLMVIFNTTVHEGNFADLPELVEFFIAHAGELGLVSFQLQAATGRGVWGSRAAIVSLESVRLQIDAGTHRALPWDVIRVGHPRCHSYVPTWVIGGQVFPVIDDAGLFAAFLHDLAVPAGSGATPLPELRHVPLRSALRSYVGAALARPVWFWRALKYLVRLVWQSRRHWLRGAPTVRKLSFFVHNFMDAKELDPERTEACSFMVMTSDGPQAMCSHNARRDEFVLKPFPVRRHDGTEYTFEPLRAKTDHSRATP
jgi:pyruvate-formate lyase-activating enzyme